MGSDSDPIFCLSTQLAPEPGNPDPQNQVRVAWGTWVSAGKSVFTEVPINEMVRRKRKEPQSVNHIRKTRLLREEKVQGKGDDRRT